MAENSIATSDESALAKSTNTHNHSVSLHTEQRVTNYAQIKTGPHNIFALPSFLGEIIYTKLDTWWTPAVLKCYFLQNKLLQQENRLNSVFSKSFSCTWLHFYIAMLKYKDI